MHAAVPLTLLTLLVGPGLAGVARREVDYEIVTIPPLEFKPFTLIDIKPDLEKMQKSLDEYKRKMEELDNMSRHSSSSAPSKHDLLLLALPLVMVALDKM